MVQRPPGETRKMILAFLRKNGPSPWSDVSKAINSSGLTQQKKLLESGEIEVCGKTSRATLYVIAKKNKS